MVRGEETTSLILKGLLLLLAPIILVRLFEQLVKWIEELTQSLDVSVHVGDSPIKTFELLQLMGGSIS